ncbi:hypothetical protein SODALDRAFT_192154 [Sodiomyces alkalinus F11]|uniref:Uncharacterized protein n=1 Tax=Sodiomyces alkalinus (strain CBS 110278 / VKM F-3762 / F11) TaxID=1314773 RepID=A0A3N2PRT7_SODAK|nr:hypothetical protein SODALDRAFT_192154 [Sodiomyces alkalinus F11]ROT37231.1 hypothetical protein SODALDRAFT_192154 [Sodiomyces alkalinus F11]
MRRIRSFYKKSLNFVRGVRTAHRRRGESNESPLGPLQSNPTMVGDKSDVTDVEWPLVSPSMIYNVSYLFNEGPPSHPSSPAAVPVPVVCDDNKAGLPFDDLRRVKQWRKLTGYGVNDEHDEVRIRSVRIQGPTRKLYCRALPGNSAGTLFGTCDRCDAVGGCRDREHGVSRVAVERKLDCLRVSQEPPGDRLDDDTRQGDAGSEESKKGKGKKSMVPCRLGVRMTRILAPPRPTSQTPQLQDLVGLEGRLQWHNLPDQKSEVLTPGLEEVMAYVEKKGRR